MKNEFTRRYSLEWSAGYSATIQIQNRNTFKQLIDNQKTLSTLKMSSVDLQEGGQYSLILVVTDTFFRQQAPLTFSFDWLVMGCMEFYDKATSLANVSIPIFAEKNEQTLMLNFDYSSCS